MSGQYNHHFFCLFFSEKKLNVNWVESEGLDFDNGVRLKISHPKVNYLMLFPSHTSFCEIFSTPPTYDTLNCVKMSNAFVKLVCRRNPLLTFNSEFGYQYSRCI